jgi:hypothetical protein
LKPIIFNQKPVLFIVVLLLLSAKSWAVPQGNEVVLFAGNSGVEQFNALHRLSDGTILVGGHAKDFNWLPSGTPVATLTGTGTLDSRSDTTVAYIMHLSSNLSTIIRVLQFPAGSAHDVSRIRSTEVPGSTTGNIYISGQRTRATGDDGYYIAKLNGNFVIQPTTGLSWVRNIMAGGEHKSEQGWDVGPNGEVYYTMGTPYQYDWSSIRKMNSIGVDTAVAYWRTHYVRRPDSSLHEINVDKISDYQEPNPVHYSTIVLKPGRGALRSHTAEDYNRILTDATGNTKMGTWPNDYYYSGPINYNIDSAKVTEISGPGYTGYRLPFKTFRCVAISVDRRNGNWYWGYNVQSTLPSGNPDFEPAVVAMEPNGNLRWWSRLYQETNQNSTPDQYVDALEIDYSNHFQGGSLVVVARSHGNNTYNFWKGSGAFQNQFTGTLGNIHYSWIGRFALNHETLISSTYLAELSEGQNPGGSYGDPLLEGWYSLNTGWPNLNTTKTIPNSLRIDGSGNVYVIGIGRQTITTSNAYVENIKPGQESATIMRTWTNFVRVYKPDFSLPLYSSLFNTTDLQDPNAGAQNTTLKAVLPVQDGLLLVGSHRLNNGYGINGSQSPDWGKSNSGADDAFLAFLTFAGSDSPVNNVSREGRLGVQGIQNTPKTRHFDLLGRKMPFKMGM